MTVEQAAHFIASVGIFKVSGSSDEAHARIVRDAAGRVLSDPLTAQTLYRVAAKKLHPDANGGIACAAWTKLQQAVALLRKHLEERGQSTN